MSISSRKAGAIVQCPTCGEQTLVPMEDIFTGSSQAAPPEEPAVEETETSAPVVSFVASAEPQEPVLEASKPIEVSAEEHDDEPGLAPPLVLRRRTRTDDDMDLTPMVDVTFQLLIFFMVTASFALQKSIDVPTPDPDKKGAAQQLQILEDLEGTSIKVLVDAANLITIDDEPLPDPSRLADALKDKMRKEQKTEILITANAAALHRSVIAVIDAANSVGMQKIRLVSRQAKGE